MTNQVDKVAEKGMQHSISQAEKKVKKAVPKIIKKPISKKGTIQSTFSFIRKFRQEKI